MNVILKDIDNLPTFSFLRLDQSNLSKEFFSVVEANRKIQDLEAMEFQQRTEARLIKHRANVADAVAIIEGMVTNNARKKTDKKSKSAVSKCSVSGCQKAATLLCPKPIANYCEGRKFCPDHCKLHTDHTGEGSKLKKIRDRSSTSINTLELSDEDDIVLRPDIYCAVIECDGKSISFCEGTTRKCKGRKFCATHGPLCCKHEAQSLKEVVVASNMINMGESESDSESSIENTPAPINIMNNTDFPDIALIPKEAVESCNTALSSSVQLPDLPVTVSELEYDNNNKDKRFEDVLKDAAVINKLQPVGPNYSFSKRSVKPGVIVLYFYLQEWHLAKVSTSRRSEQGFFRLNLLSDTSVWLDDELNFEKHGQDKEKWILMTNID